ncbi:MAG TPA: EAL domain-containing protein, partial [Gammaproteobacteria bacterium]|nr:EAL domain-containing protein [Gammaproteobacteria bacterium]
ETLAAELAILYENIELYNVIQKHAADLQMESRKRKKVQEELRKNEKMFRQFAENIDQLFFVASPTFDTIIYINSGYQKIFGRTSESLYQDPKSWINVVFEEDKKIVAEELDKIVYQEKNGSLKYRIVRPDGTIRYIYSKVSCIKDKKGRFINIIGIASDITEYMQNQKSVQLKNQIQDLFDKSLSLREVAPKLLQLLRVTFGWNIAELWLIDFSKNTIRNIENSADSNNKYSEFLTIASHLAFPYAKDLPGEIWRLKAPIWIEDYLNHPNCPRNAIAEKYKLRQALGFPLIYRKDIFGVITFFAHTMPKPDDYFMNMLSAIGNQIGEYINHKFTTDQLLSLTKKDILTGLTNRVSMEEELDNILREKPNQNLAVCIVGIDRFQLVNQVFGFEFGDVLLKNIAQRLIVYKPQGFLFRASGAKFGFVLLNVQSDNLHEFIEKLFLSFKSPFIVAEQYLIENISIGISMYPKDGDNAKKLLQNAEIANRTAHLEGGNQVRFFEKQLTLASSAKLILENDIKQALNHEEFCLYFQPKVDIQTQTITGFEALLRWKHPEKGMINPLEFIHLAEETGLIIPLGDWVIDEACKTLKQLNALNKKLSIAINISIRQLMEHDFIKKLQQVIDTYNIIPETLQLEVTESYILSQGPQFKEIVKFLKDTVGVSVAFDDFGTGYSALSYLTYAQIDVIKIDKSFINGIPNVANNVAIIRGIISIAQTLLIKTVAEGVETEQQWNFLLDAGCDEV